MDLGSFQALTFDCYGTLIDWERGILDGLHRVLRAHDVDPPDDDTLLERYAAHEAELEAGPYRTYREVVAASLRGVCEREGVVPTDVEAAGFANAVGDWPPFPDSADALERLGARYRLGVLTNCDDDLFARSADRLGARFAWVVTAQQVGSYKPAEANFHRLLETLGLPRAAVLHVAQSLYHDHAPARRLGLATVWIDRRGGRGSGATPPVEASYDLRFPDMRSFADAACAPD